MSYISKRAEKFVKTYIADQVSDHKKVIEEAKNELYEIDVDFEKTTFLRVILEENEKEYQKHLVGCNHKDTCDTNYDHESISYFLNQELNKLGIRTNNDQFTSEEKISADSKLDILLADVQLLKDGQQIIYDALKSEIDELKELYILGKKRWYQMLLGKTTEMVISGVISETISKEIVSTMSHEIKQLL